jgi:anti-sigma factor RsiW
MTPDQELGHATPDELLDYFEAKLPDERERVIEEHLAVCNACTQTARQVFSLHEVWNRWTARAHGEVYARDRLRAAIAQAEQQTTNPLWRERLRAWRLRWAGRAEAALRLATETSAEVSRAAAETLDALTRPGSVLVFAPVRQAGPVRGEATEQQRSAVLSTTLRPGHPRARVVVEAGQSGTVTVRVDEVRPGETAPLVLLSGMTATRTAVLQVKEVEPQPGVAYAIARFDDLPPGEYVLAFEPLES